MSEEIKIKPAWERLRDAYRRTMHVVVTNDRDPIVRVRPVDIDRTLRELDRLKSENAELMQRIDELASELSGIGEGEKTG